MDIVRVIEVFALVTGLVYVVLEIGQKNLMWVLGILTGAACAWSFGVQNLWASMALNIYYVGVSFWGLVQWKRDGAAVGDALHLRRLPRNVALLSLAVFVAGTAALAVLLRLLGDSATLLDAVVTVLSAIGTWWLAKSYPWQWLVFIVADILSTVLCAVSGLWAMALLYLVYIAAAVYGWFYWNKKGIYV